MPAWGNISRRMLTLTLKHLQRSGLVDRTAYAEVPPRVEYSLTGLGAPALRHRAPGRLEFRASHRGPTPTGRVRQERHTQCVTGGRSPEAAVHVPALTGACGPPRSPRGRHSMTRSASSSSSSLTLSPSRIVRHHVSWVTEMLRKPRRPLVLGAALIVALIVESAAIVAQQEQIDDLRTQHIDLQGHLLEPSPSGPSGPLARPAPQARRERTGRTGRTGRTDRTVGMGGMGGMARRVRTGRTAKTLQPSHHRPRAGVPVGRLTAEPSRAAPPPCTRGCSTLP